MATRQERDAERQLKEQARRERKLQEEERARIKAAAQRERELQLAAEFTKKVVSPILANILEDGRHAAFPMTLRQVRDYGRDGVRCFRLMFKLLQRGGRTKEGVPFKTHWVVNTEALRPYIEWSQMEEPLSKLLEMLTAAGTNELVWNKVGKKWLNKTMKDLIRKAKRTKEEREQAEALQ